MKKLLAALAVFFFSTAVFAQKIEPLAPLPSARQLAWHDLDFYLFAHFGPNTFTGQEWGDGRENPSVFNPERLDPQQWCRIARAAGAKGFILTAKHHDGFCLWPTALSEHSVSKSAWRGGTGDVVSEFAEACRVHGLGYGVYLSPWDRNHPKYGSDEYNAVFAAMLSEIVSSYGEPFEMWWDGANGEGPNGRKQVYNFPFFEEMMRDIAPNTPIFSDIGPDVRWIGNESGLGAKTNWNFLDTVGFLRGFGAPPTDTLMQGNRNGPIWLPAEADVSIRPGWFWRPSEDEKVKTPEQLFRIYLQTVGRGANLLLNVPPNSEGLISAPDSASLIGFQRLLSENFAFSLVENALIRHSDGSNFQKTDRLNDRSRSSFEALPTGKTGLKIDLKKPTRVNCVSLREPIQMGQRVAAFDVFLKNDEKVVRKIAGTTIGNRRILTFETVEADEIEVVVQSARAVALLSEVDAFLIDEKLIEREDVKRP